MLNISVSGRHVKPQATIGFRAEPVACAALSGKASTLLSPFDKLPS